MIPFILLFSMWAVPGDICVAHVHSLMSWPLLNNFHANLEWNAFGGAELELAASDVSFKSGSGGRNRRLGGKARETRRRLPVSFSSHRRKVRRQACTDYPTDPTFDRV
jgi:hypothetical protein